MARFYTDEDISPKTVRQLQFLGHDVVTTVGEGRARATDDDQLLHTTQQARIFITHNRRDFVLLHDAWERWSKA